MDYDDSMDMIVYLNRRVPGWWQWATAEPWTWPKIEAYYCRLVGVEA